MSRVVFVGNVPYNMSEDQLIEVFRSVGQVIGFRLVFDRETGKPRGYGFCEFADHETALSAVRNLNNTDVGGRPLRIDLADSDPFLEGKTTVRGEIVDGGVPGPSEPRSHWRSGSHADRSKDTNAVLANLPPGIQIPPGASALDYISQTLASMAPAQLMEVLAQMKAFVITHPEQSKTLLIAHPQLAYALFQALLLNKIVDPAILQRMLAATTAGAASQAPRLPTGPSHLQQPPQYSHHPGYAQLPQQVVAPLAPTAMVAPTPQAVAYSHQPAPHAHLPTLSGQPGMPSTQSFYRTAPTGPVGAGALAPQQLPSEATARPPGPASQELSDQHRQMLFQVFSLTQEQIDSLPETERAAIVQLRSQFMGALNV